MDQQNKTVQDRGYQSDSVSQIIDGVKKGHKKILLVLPTGGGKTTIYAMLVKRLLENRVNSVFIVDRKELVEQATDRLLGQFGINSGMIMAGAPYVDLPTQTASIQSLVRRDLHPAKVVFVDEAHGILANTYQKVTEKYTAQGSVIIGLTATPFRGDGKSVLAEFDLVIHPITMLELIDQGFLTPTKIFIVKDIDFSGVGLKSGEYDKVEVESILLNTDIAKDVYSRYSSLERPRALFFCSTVSMSKYYCEFFLKRGVKAVHLDGTTDKAYRASVVAKYKAGEIEALFNVDLFCQGFDAPCTTDVFLLRKTRSPNRYLQMVGRGMRPFPKKAEGRVWDYGNNALEHGPPEKYDQLDFERFNKEHRKKGKILGKKCPSCFAVIAIAARSCDCGQTFKPVVEELSLRAGEVSLTMEVFTEDIPTVQKILAYKSSGKVPTEFLRAFFVLHGKNPAQAIYLAHKRGHVLELPTRSDPRSFGIANNQLAAYERANGSRDMYERVKKKLKRGSKRKS